MNSKYLNNPEHVRLYKGGDIRISNSAQEAEQLRRQGWSDTLPEGVTLDEKKVAEAERVFLEGMEPELEGESITPDNLAGAAVPPVQQASTGSAPGGATRNVTTGEAGDRASTGENAVMGTRDVDSTGSPANTRDVTRRVSAPKPS